MDAWALRSHQRAVAAIDAGKFIDEIFPVEVVNRAGERSMFAVDEHPGRDSSMEKLASLKPLHPEIEGFSITAGNAGGINDGAAAMVLTDSESATPRARTSGYRPGVGLGRCTARRRRASLRQWPCPRPWPEPGSSIGRLDLWEINEAFASMCVATARILGIDDGRW